MKQERCDTTAFLTAVLSSILVSCLISWDSFVPFSFPIISRHIEPIFLLCGWGIALLCLIRYAKGSSDKSGFQVKEIKGFIIWLVVFAVGNLILYFIRSNLFTDPDMAEVLWEQRLYFCNIILSFLPWAFVLINTHVAVFERTINYVAAITQILYFFQCILVKSWYMPFGNKNRIEILYIGLLAFPILVYELCFGRLYKTADRFLAMANIALCLFFSVVGTSRQALVSAGCELIVAVIIVWRLTKLHPNRIKQVKCITTAVILGVFLTIFMAVANIFNARSNIARSFLFTGSEFDLTTGRINVEVLEEVSDTEFFHFLQKMADGKTDASTTNPPIFSDSLRAYWRELAIENNLQSPFITNGRVSYIYTSPTGVEYRSGAHNAIIDYWSLFGLIGLIWVGAFGVYLFIAQFYPQRKGMSADRILCGISAITAEAISFGFALTQCVYLHPFTFAFLIVIASWCRAMNRECLDDVQKEEKYNGTGAFKERNSIYHRGF